MIYGETGTTPLHITIEKRIIGYWLQIIMGSSSKLNYQIYKYILHLDMQNIYSSQWIRKIKEILQRCGLFHIWVNQHSIRIEDSKAIRLLICTRINDQYEQTWHSSIPTHIRCSYYVLFKDNRKLEPYLYKLSAIEYTYLNLDVEATICQSLKYINTRIHMTPSVKYVIKMKLEMNSTIYLFVQYFRKTAIDCSKSITENFQVCINLLN